MKPYRIKHLCPKTRGGRFFDRVFSTKTHLVVNGTKPETSPARSDRKSELEPLIYDKLTLIRPSPHKWNPLTLHVFSAAQKYCVAKKMRRKNCICLRCKNLATRESVDATVRGGDKNKCDAKVAPACGAEILRREKATTKKTCAAPTEPRSEKARTQLSCKGPQQARCSSQRCRANAIRQFRNKCYRINLYQTRSDNFVSTSSSPRAAFFGQT